MSTTSSETTQAHEEEITAKEAAQRAGIPYRTFARYLGHWLAQKVEGIRLVRAKGRSGQAYRVALSVLARLTRGEITRPVPKKSGPRGPRGAQ